VATGPWCYPDDLSDSLSNCAVLTESPYVFAAVRNGAQKLLSATKPSVDFTNTNPTGCPTVFTLLKTDLAPLDGGLENILSITADGDIQLDESQYTGGAMAAKVKAVTAFGTPLYKTITITEKCGR
jgi:hypothetical protein